MQKAGYDGLLLFNQASRYWLTGYDSFGFVLFECLYLGADGRLVLLTRPVDVPAARYTSTISDIRIWEDGDGRGPAAELKKLLQSVGCAGKRLGIEYETWGLTGRKAKQVDAALDGFCRLVDESEFISKIRNIKSPAELVYVRRAGELANEALSVAIKHCHDGAFEGDILAAAQGTIFRGGGDYPGNEFTIASGEGALLSRYFSGRRHLHERDQLMLQIGGAYRRYHAALMATPCVGAASSRHKELHAVASEALLHAHDELRPGRPLHLIYDRYRSLADKAGMSDCALSGCGYSLGAAYHPTWMEWPWIHAGTEVPAQEGMVVYVYMILVDQQQSCAVAVADTSLVTKASSERITSVPESIIEC